MWKRRKELFCGNQSVSYSNDEPLMIVKGDGAYLIDSQGNKYLDTRNNVGHVGWQHPKVVEALRAQIETCNVNTRYLHPARVEVAEKLTSIFNDATGETNSRLVIIIYDISSEILFEFQNIVSEFWK